MMVIRPLVYPILPYKLQYSPNMTISIAEKDFERIGWHPECCVIVTLPMKHSFSFPWQQGPEREEKQPLKV